MERNFAPLLVTIICEVVQEFGIVMTESYREKKHDSDLHGVNPVRAIDKRCWCYKTDQMAYKIMHFINKKYVYDQRRPEKDVAIIHNAGQGRHTHIQVHPNTKRRYI